MNKISSFEHSANSQEMTLFSESESNAVLSVRKFCNDIPFCAECAALACRLEDGYEALASRANAKTLVNSSDDTNAAYFNRWQSITYPDIYEYRILNRFKPSIGRRVWIGELRTVYGDTDHGIVIKAKGEDFTKAGARDLMFEQYLNKLDYNFKIEVQMDTIQGDTTQTSIMENNTIITEDTSVQKTLSYAGQGPRLNLVTTEPTHSFDSIMNRWMPFQTFTLSTTPTAGTEVFYVNIPEAFYSDTVTPNLTQFRNFIFGEIDVEMRVIVNAHRFQCGKLVLCVFPDPYQGLATRRTMQNALQFPHVIIDLNGNNHGVLEIPFKYRRPLMRLVSNPQSNKGVRGGVYGAVGCYYLSQMRTGADQPLTCVMRTFFRFKRNTLAGMSYQVTVQGDCREQMDDIKGICEGVGMTIKGVEKTLVRAGHLINWDKPQDVNSVVQTVPRPRLNFYHGVGISDAVQMRMSPYATDVLPEQLYRPNDPQSVHDMARIWGYMTTFQWIASDNPGQLIWSWLVDPANVTENFPVSGGANDVGVPAPFTFVNGMYNFWSGPIEIRLDFVSNEFITGTCQIAFEPNRPSSTELQAQSTYTKTFHLGEQKSLTFTVPYINDNVMRRTGVESWNNITDSTPPVVTQANAQAVRMQPRNYVSVRVINALRSVATTTSTIDVLVFIRAGEHYINLSPVMSSWQVNGTTSNEVVNFPGTFPTSVPGSLSAISIPDYYQEVTPKFSSWAIPHNPALTESERTPAILRPTGLPDRYRDLDGREINFKMANLNVREQMDNGEKEDLDPTMDFSQGGPRKDLVVTDKHDNIIDIMRRPVQLYSLQLLTANFLNFGAGTTYMFYIPVMPPGPMWRIQTPAINKVMDSVLKTPQACLTSCFRHWRGSLRFTFIFHNANYQSIGPVYISYLPHNGTLINGIFNYPRGGAGRSSYNIGPHSVGLTTEMVIPSINPSITIEVPYENEFDYMLTSEEDMSRNYAWREKNAYNNGHLVVFSNNAVYMDVWVAAGDSFYLCDFQGTYRTRNYNNPQLPTDNNPTVTALTIATPESRTGSRRPHPQVIPNNRKDFQEINLRSGPRVDGNIRIQMDTIRQISDNIIDSKYFVPGMSVAGVVTGIPLSNAALGLKGDRALTQAREQYDGLVSVIKQTITSLADKLHAVMDVASVAALASEICIDIILLVRNFDIVSAVLTGIKLVGKILGNYGLHCISFSNRIAEWVSTHTFGPREQLSGLEDSNHSLVALIVGCLGIMANVSFTSKDVSHWAKDFSLQVTSVKGVAFFNSVFTFIKNYYGLLEAIMTKAFGLTDPYALSVNLLKEQITSIGPLMSDIDTYTSGLNKKQYTHARFRFLYWKTYMQALTLKNLLLRLPRKDQHVGILRQCEKMIKHADENATACSNVPIRYVPFVLCIDGKSEIGKSYLVNAIATVFFEATNTVSRTGNDIFVRNSVAKNWDGFDGQLIVHMDDVFNLQDSETVVSTLRDIYALKTTAQFIPEKAHLDEKGKTENPIGVVQTTNNPFPNVMLSNISACPEAVLRRRDMLIKAECIYGCPVTELTEEQTENMGHLRFREYADVRQESSLGEAFDWDELKTRVHDRIKIYHEKELKAVKYRMSEALKRMGAGASLIDPNLDPFTFVNRVFLEVNDIDLDTNVFLPSEILAQSLPAAQRVFDTLSVSSSSVHEQGPFVNTVACIGASLVSAFATTSVCSFVKNYIKNSKCLLCERKVALKTCSSGHNVCSDCCPERCEVVVGSLACGETQYTVDTTTFYRVMQAVRAAQQETPEMYFDYLRSMGRLLLNCYDAIPLNVLGLGCVALLSYFQKREPTTMFSFHDEQGRRWIVQTQGDDLPGYVGSPRHFADTSGVLRALRTYGFEFDVERCRNHFRNMKCKSTLEWFGMRRKVVAEFEKCVHVAALPYMDYIKYVNGMWECRCSNATIMVPDNKSQCYDCQWSEDHYIQVVRTWWEQEYPHLLNRISNCGFNRDTILTMIPEHIIFNQYTLSDFVDDSVINNKFFSCLKAVGLVISGIGAAYGLYQTYHWMFAKENLEQIEFSGDQRTRHFQRAKEKTERRTVRIKEPAHEQIETLEDVVLDKLVANSCIMKLYYLSGEVVKMAMTGVKERIAILPKHYVNRLRHDEELIEKIEIGRANNELSFHEYALDFKDFLVSKTSDIAVFYLPISQSMFKDITKFMQTDDDLQKPMASRGIMLRMPSTRVSQFMRVPLKFYGFKKRVAVSGIENFEQYDVLYYNYSSDGACGSLVLKANSQKPIVGMHFAGSGDGHSGEGYAILVSKDMMDDIEGRTLLSERCDVSISGEASESPMLMPAHVQVEYLGVVDKSIYLPKKSKIIPSLIQADVGKVYGTLTKPCFLSRDDPEYPHSNSPLVAGCMKHGLLTKDFPTSDLDIMQEYLYDKYTSQLEPNVMSPKLLTVSEAVSGFDGIEGYDAMKLDTSIGYPLNTQGVVSKREDIQILRDDKGVNKVIVSDRVMKLYNDDMNGRKKGVVPATIYTAFLKDERKKLEKRMKEGSTRIFLMSSAHYTIAKRQYFLHWFAANMSNRSRHYSAVGIRCDSNEWSELVNNLLEIGGNIFTLDYSNFGPGFNSGVNFRCLLNAKRWLLENVDMPEGSEIVLDSFIEEHANSIHIMKDLVYKQWSGGPSGDPGTVNHNSDVNMGYCVLAWKHIWDRMAHEDGNYSQIWREFEDHVFIKVYGDDLIASVSDKYKNYYNAKTISEYFATMGIVATDASKAKEVTPYGSLGESTFLKRGFKPHPVHAGEWLAPLDKASITEACQWIFKSPNDEEATIQNAEASIRMAYGHGPQFFDAHKKVVNECLKKRGMQPVPVTWSYIDQDFFPLYYGKRRSI